jgi:signal peptidase I
MAKVKKELKEEKEEDMQKKAAKDIFLDVYPYIVIILVVIIIRSFIVTPIKVNQTSMHPTLEQGDTMLLNKIGASIQGYKRFDIVVVKSNGSYLIKRIIGMPGESIKYTDGKLYINEKVMKDKYAKSETEDFDEVKIGKNEYFVMGDNRAVSKDSRIIGPVSKSQLLGKTNIIIFPFSRLGKV